MTTQSEFIEINWDGRSLRLEISLIGKTGSDSPIIVFLHEGLGSISSWNDFPTRLCNALSCRGLVYSRPGYGQSTPFDQDASWGMDFMHRQAYEVLPILLDNLEIIRPTINSGCLGTATVLRLHFCTLLPFRTM